MIKIKCSADNTLPLAELTNFQGKLKTLSEVNYKKLRKQIEDNGFIVPFFVWQNDGKNYILDGHQRESVLTRMQTEGAELPDKYPVVYVQADNRRDAKKKLLAINSQYGKMTEEGLLEFIEDIGMALDELADFELPVDIENIIDTIADEKYTEEELNTVPEVKETDIKLGDIFILGSHRLMCGDGATDNLQTLMDGDLANMVFTDPPYGVSYESRVKDKFKKIQNDELRGEDLQGFICDIYSNIFQIAKDGCPIYVCAPSQKESFFIYFGVESAGWHIQSQLIWAKNAIVMGRCDYQWQHELIWYGYKGKNHYWCGDRKQGTILNVKKDGTNSYVHPTQKPVELPERVIKNSSRPGDIVFDVFGGSGSTLIACENSGRKCYTMDIEPIYCQTIIDRWEKLTGKTAVKVGDPDGETIQI